MDDPRCDAENATMTEDNADEVLTARSPADISKSSANASVYDKVASRLSERLLAALSWSAQSSTPSSGQNGIVLVNITRTNRSFTPVPPPRRSWEKFLAQLVSNLSSEAKSTRQTTPPANSVSTTSSESDNSHNATLPTTSDPSVDVARQQQLSAARSHHHHHFHHHQASRVGSGTHARSELPRTPLNLKSPPAASLNRVELSTDKPTSRSWKATTRLLPLTTPPTYLRHVQAPVTSVYGHIHHRNQHSDIDHHHIVKTPAAVSSLLWSKPANQLSAASLFHILGLWTGNNVNVTSSSMTVADMMRYVLARASHHFTAGHYSS